MYLVLKRFLYYSLPILESQRKNSRNLHVATWFLPRLVRIGRNKQLCLHYFTLNNVLQHQPKLDNASLQISSIFPVLLLRNCDFVQKSLAQLLTPKIQLCHVPIWEQGIPNRGILKSLVSHVLNFKSWIKLIYNTVDICRFVINQFNPTCEVSEAEMGL